MTQEPSYLRLASLLLGAEVTLQQYLFTCAMLYTSLSAHDDFLLSS